jgi:hypothetical protein
MARQYAPRAVLRHLPLELLRRFLVQQGIPTRAEPGAANTDGADWDSLVEGDYAAIYRAWLALPPGPRERVELMLRQVHETASEPGVRAMIAEALFRGSDIADQLAGIDGHEAKALWVLIHHALAFHTARLLLSTGFPVGRYWNLSTGFGGQAYDASRAAVQNLRLAIANLYREQGRGQRCTIEDYDRNGCLYLFVYLDDYTLTHTAHDDRGTLVRRPLRPAFEVVYVYHQAAGTLDMFASGERRWRATLRDLFCEHVLQCAAPPAPDNGRSYALDRLTDRSFTLRTDPARGVCAAEVRWLRVVHSRHPSRRVTLEADMTRPGDVYDMLDAHFPAGEFPRGELLVNQVAFTVRYRAADGDKERSFTFQVTFPDGCNLRSLPDDQRVVGEWCLREWGILNDGAAQPGRVA